MTRAGGESILEYAVMIGVVVAALTGMSLYAKRGIQSMVKSAADEMSPLREQARLNGTTADPTGEETQFLGLQYESGDRESNRVIGTVLRRESAEDTAQLMNRTRDEAGPIESSLSDSSTVTRGALTSQGPGAVSHSQVIVGEP